MFETLAGNFVGAELAIKVKKPNFVVITLNFHLPFILYNVTIDGMTASEYLPS